MKLHIFTFLTDVTRVEQLKNTQEMHNVSINYIVNSTWSGYTDKIFFTKKHIENIPDDDIVCFIDAYDVLVNSTETDIIDKFLSYNCDLLIGAELNCYPPDYIHQMDIISSKVSPETLYKYVNSGGYIGYKKAVSKVFNWKNDEEILKICQNCGDQTYFMEYYIENYLKENISLDSRCFIFQNMHLISWDEIYFKNGSVFNSIMKIKPCFIHFNGSVWLTQERNNIMPVFFEKKKISGIQPNESFNLNEYSQIITETCFPHKQTK